MQKSIVHVGYHKTATTWMQEALFPLVESHEFIPRKTVERTFLHPSGLHFCEREAAQALRLESRNRPVLLSEENLTGYLHNAGLHGLMAPEAARRIKTVLPDARILIFVRNQYNICRSSYAQYINAGGTWSQNRYFQTERFVDGALSERWKAPVFEFEQFEFDRLIAYYDDLFGADCVHVYPYEWWRDRDAMIDRLEADLGMTFTARPESEGRANVSLGSARLSVLRFANAFTRQCVINKDCIVLPGGRQFRSVTKATLRTVPNMCKAKHKLPGSVEEHIRTFYPDSNRRLMASRDLPLEELGYPV